ncbi:hypothetical protein ACIHCV_11845 [Streptomyces sp. NPDC051956]|uniref:hypothetical protein n=1 Tax=Streptomyces sp. NPDC051956 TaxID=3365677 RepID=UPI0037D6E8A0
MPGPRPATGPRRRKSLAPTARPLSAAGIELLRSAAGGNPHALVADEGVRRWTARVVDPTGLALGMIENTAAACLIHPEHGGTGIAPGRYLVRRQRERAASRQGWRGGDMLVADRRHASAAITRIA